MTLTIDDKIVDDFMNCWWVKAPPEFPPHEMGIAIDLARAIYPKWKAAKDKPVEPPESQPVWATKEDLKVLAETFFAVDHPVSSDYATKADLDALRDEMNKAFNQTNEEVARLILAGQRHQAKTAEQSKKLGELQTTSSTDEQRLAEIERAFDENRNYGPNFKIAEKFMAAGDFVRTDFWNNGYRQGYAMGHLQAPPRLPPGCVVLMYEGASFAGTRSEWEPIIVPVARAEFLVSHLFWRKPEAADHPAILAAFGVVPE